MKPAIPQISGQFSLSARDKGLRDYLADLVRDYSGDDESAEASVDGPEYLDEVSIDFEDGRLVASCTCDPFASGAFCRHIWAVLLMAGDKGHLKTPAALPSIRLEHIEDDEDFLDDDADFPPPRRGADPKTASWKQRLRDIQPRTRTFDDTVEKEIDQVVYFMVPEQVIRDGRASLHIGTRRRLQNGNWSTVKEIGIQESQLSLLTLEDRRIVSLLMNSDYWSASLPAGGIRLNEEKFRVLLPMVCATGRFYLGTPWKIKDALKPVRWEEEPWSHEIRMKKEKGFWILKSVLVRGPRELEPDAATFLLSCGLGFIDDTAAPLNFIGDFNWLYSLKREGEFRIPESDLHEFRKEIYQHSNPPRIVWPDEAAFAEIRIAPQARLRVTTPKGDANLHATLQFDYETVRIDSTEPRSILLDPDGKRALVRDRERERQCRSLLREIGFQKNPWTPDAPYRLAPKKFPKAVHRLLREGWQVEAEKILYKRPSSFKISVTTGIDWFELEGGVEFEGKTVPFPRLLHALRKGEAFVTLDDGSQGMIPEEWLAKTGFLLQAGEADEEGNKLRFKPSQALLLDALLTAEQRSTCDAAFESLRTRLSGFEGIRPAEPPSGFQGELRPYQKEGLGWLLFLREFRFGGCLADDMGLGKTVQVLALLESIRGSGTTLVVVPRSLVFNWKAEAARFAPGLRVIDHTGLTRTKDLGALKQADLVLTTYGTLRRDAAILKDLEFEYVILDEAQAVKNASSATAKASLLLRGRHRLALSGTPIENHLGELWSLFEFLNPGMLGRASVFQTAVEHGEVADRALLARALRPFILRRTKEKVATDLPEKIQQTLVCDLEPGQRKLYDELKAHYQASLLKLDDTSFERSKFQVLEALLRLRQAACHPGLIDRAYRDEPAVKLDLLMDKLREATEEGHKALVFSQFTSFLSIVRARLDAEKVPYVYLDGQTRDRQEVVTRFQTDPDVRLFLISLKAGGQGLNLTAAEYVFLLDPWWNPAVEAQAIDRTHRIGQTRRVFAYRIVARNTVEERVLELQQRKRELANAILDAEGGVLRELSREDLALLLS
jgi:superfamily II DNA or RNA helicase